MVWEAWSNKRGQNLLLKKCDFFSAISRQRNGFLGRANCADFQFVSYSAVSAAYCSNDSSYLGR